MQRRAPRRVNVHLDGASLSEIEQAEKCSWSQRDKDKRAELLRELRDTNPGFPFLPPFVGPGTASLLGLPREVVLDRLVQWFTTCNIVGSLMLSGLCSFALVPLDVKSMPDEDQNLGNIFNMINMYNLTLNAGIVIFTTYSLLQLTVETPGTILRCAVYSMRSVWISTFTFFSTVMLLVSTGITAWLHQTGIFKIVTVIGIIFIFFVFAAYYMYYLMPLMFPIQCLHWSNIFGFIPESLREDARRIGQVRLMEAKTHIGDEIVNDALKGIRSQNSRGPGSRKVAEQPTLEVVVESLEEDRDSDHASGHAKPFTRQRTVMGAPINPIEQDSFMKILDIAAPSMLQSRKIAIAHKLIEEAFTFAVMKQSPSSVLYDALGDEGLELNLKSGERLAICAAVSSCNGSELAPVDAPDPDPDHASESESDSENEKEKESL